MVALYACALKAASRPLPGNYEPVAKKLLPRLDDCWRFCVEAFKEHDSMFYAVGMWVVIITLGLALWGIAQVYTDEKPS